MWEYSHSQPGEQIHPSDPPDRLQNISQRHKAWNWGTLRFGAHPLLTSQALLDTARAHTEQLLIRLVAKNIPSKRAFPTEWGMAVIQHQPWQEGNPGLRA